MNTLLPVQSSASSVSRRDALKLGMALGVAGLTLPSWAAEPALITKPVPSTGEALPVIGVGTNSFKLDNLDNLQTMIARMHALGGKVIDTAASYGESEATIGQLLSNLKLRKSFFISTKFANSANDGVTGEASVERSLQRLQTDYLDLLMVHSLRGVDEYMPKLVEWKKAGRIRYLGMTTSDSKQHADMVAFMKKYPLDFVQVNYSIESREAEQEVLPTALERKIGVMVNVPFGGRGGRTLLSADGKPLPPWAKDIGCETWAAFLLKFVVSHPAVTLAIPGSTKVEHLEANQVAARGVLPDSKLRQQMQSYWDEKV